MKYIIKQSEPQELTALRESASEDWQPTFEDLQRIPKEAVHASLLAEQGYICCYCNMRISADSSHIEHFKPRSKFPEAELEYENLLASCQLETQRREPRRCGMKKRAWFHRTLLISPLQEDCESRFRFAADGAIYPANDNDQAARETILRLGLDNDELVRRRVEAIDAVFVDMDKFEHGEIRRLIDAFHQRDENGRFEPFCSAITYILQDYLGYESSGR